MQNFEGFVKYCDCGEYLDECNKGCKEVKHG